MRLTLRDLDLDAVRPYIDSLPFYGRITGSVSGSGYLDAMDVSLDWAFADARVPGNPISLVAGDGVVGASARQRTHLLRFPPPPLERGPPAPCGWWRRR